MMAEEDDLMEMNNFDFESLDMNFAALEEAFNQQL
jgi:hypothetical protein